MTKSVNIMHIKVSDLKTGDLFKFSGDLVRIEKKICVVISITPIYGKATGSLRFKLIPACSECWSEYWKEELMEVLISKCLKII